jgi:lipopolysaccharide transport system ATP-binding protein
MEQKYMSDTIIRVENLSKKYILGHQKEEGYVTLRDAISNSAKGLLKPFQGSKSKVSNHASEEFWALKDVSFEINQGDRLGIIGRNGAGKSTLLKILSRIVEPTRGQIGIKGRVASLLEVGTGFHPELTGRENISLNGAILGMSKAEITRKFDEIVAFAEVEKFLDTPVKRYSSGMYVRLAFSVAAHLEPEILIVDEVLAVGDAQFQKKCLGKMEAVGKEGRTIIFVSHSMGAITTLCDKVVFLEKGKVRDIGEVNKVANIYLSELFDNSASDLSQLRLPGMGKEILFSDIQLVSDNESNLLFGENLKFMLTIRSSINMSNLIIGVSLYNNSGSCVGSLLTENIFSIRSNEEISVSVKMLNTNLAPGSYYASFGLGQKDTQMQFDGVVGKPHFQILPISAEKLQSISNWNSTWGNICFRESEMIVVK